MLSVLWKAFNSSQERSSFTVHKNEVVLLWTLVGSYDQDPKGNTIKESIPIENTLTLL